MNGEIKKNTDFISTLYIDKGSALPIHVQLAEAFRRRIIQNRMRPGTVLPSERLLAEHFQINRDTVHRAYDTLIEDGFSMRPQGRRSVVIAEKAPEKYRPSFPSIGIMMPSGFSSYIKLASRNSITYLTGIIDRAAEMGHSTIILSLPPADSSPKEVAAWMENFVGRTIGIIYLGPGRDLPVDKPLEALFAEQRMPQVFVSGCSELKNISSINGDTYDGGMNAAKLLMEQGHRRVGVFHSSQEIYLNDKVFRYYAASRTKIMLECFDKAGLTVKREWTVEHYGLEADKIQAEVDRIYSLREKPTAIWCQNDETAFSVIEALRKRNIRVPEDVSVIGFDDIESGLPGKPFLTTIRQPRYEIGKKAIDLVIDLFETGVPGAAKQLKLPTTLVVRDSVGRVRRNQ